jgi:2-polyprenyl-3-methyl-5-hydroxy-6-metoxy-1,4-benzoquinol methylase
MIAFPFPRSFNERSNILIIPKNTMIETSDENLRFAFGKNWTNFIANVEECHVLQAERSLQDMLRRQSLEGLRFIDVGCGSGLFSLAAVRLGAQEVFSFDYDTSCVSCAQHLRKKLAPQAHWHIFQGSVLDQQWLTGLGSYDLVYSWGVLHHTGAMWQAFENVAGLVAHKGTLFISIYNDQGLLSRFWHAVKICYNRCTSNTVRTLLVTAYHCLVLINRTILGIVKQRPVKEWYNGSYRGMSLWYDSVDWVGGYPFETASTHEIITYFHERGFALRHVRSTRGSGCNEFVFERIQ